MIDIDDSLFAPPAAPAPERRGEDLWRAAGKGGMTFQVDSQASSRRSSQLAAAAPTSSIAL